MRPQALSVLTVKSCLYCKPSLSCRSSVTGCSALYRRPLYNYTDFSNNDNLQWTHWHTFFFLRLPSICQCLPILAHIYFFRPTSRLFSSRSIKCFLKRFVSLCLFSLSNAASFLFALFIRVILLAAQLHLYFYFSVVQCPPSVAIYLLSLSESFSLSRIKYYKCCFILARGLICPAINQYR